MNVIDTLALHEDLLTSTVRKWRAQPGRETFETPQACLHATPAKQRRANEQPEIDPPYWAQAPTLLSNQHKILEHLAPKSGTSASKNVKQPSWPVLESTHHSTYQAKKKRTETTMERNRNRERRAPSKHHPQRDWIVTYKLTSPLSRVWQTQPKQVPVEVQKLHYFYCYKKTHFVYKNNLLLLFLHFLLPCWANSGRWGHASEYTWMSLPAFWATFVIGPAWNSSHAFVCNSTSADERQSLAEHVYQTLVLPRTMQLMPASILLRRHQVCSNCNN